MERDKKVNNNPPLVFPSTSVTTSKDSIGVLAFGPLALKNLNSPNNSSQITSNVSARRKFRDSKMSLDELSQNN